MSTQTKKYITWIAILIPLLFMAIAVEAQDNLKVTIDSCYEWAKNNYPLIKKAALINKANKYNLANIEKGYLPQISFNSQASYQSDVTSVKVPGFNIQPLDKDQYKTTVEINETIYDGGAIKAQKKIQETSSELETVGLQKDLYAVKERINQLFFGALLLQYQLEQNAILNNDLDETKQRVQASLDNGSAYKADVDQVQSEMLLQKQKKIEIESAMDSYLQMLSVFTGKEIDSAAQLVMPDSKDNPNSIANNRPELKVFELQKKLYDTQLGLLNSKTKPRLSAFAQGGYGKPGLNQLKNQFDWFYIGGLKLSWNLNSFYTIKNDKRLLENNKTETDVQKETFLFNNNFDLIQQNREQQKINNILQTDEEIIRLKESIRITAKAKYENGVITLNDLLKEINAVSQARLNAQLHKIQSISNQYNRQFTLGN